MAAFIRANILWPRLMLLARLSACLALAGCSKQPQTQSQSQSGNLGAFLLRTIEGFGGRVRQTNITSIRGNWTSETIEGAPYLGDRQQIHIRIPGDRFQELTNFLAEALGKPSLPATTGSAGVVYGYYTQGDLGAALQFYKDAQETGLILVGSKPGTRRNTSPQQ